MMKLSAKNVYEATPILAAAINQDRPMPQKGKYRIARMHAKLYPEWRLLEDRREAILAAYRVSTVVKNEDGSEGTMTAIPDDKLPAAEAEWVAILATEIDVDVEPIPLAVLDLGDNANGSMSAQDLMALGDLVTE